MTTRYLRCTGWKVAVRGVSPPLGHSRSVLWVNLDRRIELLCDNGLEEPWDEDLVGSDPIAFPGYPHQLEEARERTGYDEALVTGVGACGGRPVAVVASAFEFFGGSMGAAVGEKVARAFERAADRSLPVVTVLASGGARMQEGLISLAQMPKTVAAAETHARRGLPQVTVCANPTAGGMWASFGSRADLILAELGATVGFAGPRVAEHVLGEPLPLDTHTPQAAVASGVVDAVVSFDEVRDRVATLLRGLEPDPVPVPTELTLAEIPPAGGSAWEMLEAVRLGELPGARGIVESVVTDFTRLSGDRSGGTDPSVVAGLGRWRGRPVVVIGQDRHKAGGRTRAAGFRLASRAADLAQKLGLPVVTLVDTPGADPAPAEERAGLVPAISALMATLLGCSTPIVSVCVGEGGSGGALALGAGDVLLMQRGTVFSVIAPSAAATILRRGSTSAAELAEMLKVRDRDAVELGVADAIAPAQVDDLADTVAAWLDRLTAADGGGELTERRLERWRTVGARYLDTL
ncbi:MAG: acetyl-CoA carboxylase carboxyl transferase subunit beta [Actinobacteria bacterium ATB1]|nr:acetyl-CoA carboxylase carboxyl transferase subunit beta [Actinobacteria bacterium ATB1]